MSQVILGKQIKVEGFTSFRWYEQWPTAFKEMAQWIQEVEVENMNMTLYIIVIYMCSGVCDLF